MSKENPPMLQKSKYVVNNKDSSEKLITKIHNNCFHHLNLSQINSLKTALIAMMNQIKKIPMHNYRNNQSQSSNNSSQINLQRREMSIGNLPVKYLNKNLLSIVMMTR